MKTVLKSLLLAAVLLSITACEKDEGRLPEITFKTGGNYLSDDVALPAGSEITVGIEAEKTESRDPLKKFNISKKVDGGAASTVVDESLSGDDGDHFEYDYTTTIGTTPQAGTRRKKGLSMAEGSRSTSAPWPK